MVAIRPRQHSPSAFKPPATPPGTRRRAGSGSGYNYGFASQRGCNASLSQSLGPRRSQTHSSHHSQSLRSDSTQTYGSDLSQSLGPSQSAIPSLGQSRGPNHAKGGRLSKHVRQLADIPRAASLRDVGVEVSVAHTPSKLRARFFVELARETVMPRRSWGFGLSFADVKLFESQMRHRVRQYNRAIRKGETKACTMCAQLKLELRQWTRVLPWEGLGKGHMDKKCARVKSFFEQLFALLSTHAQWLHECELLRELLRMTEALSHMQYSHDSDAVDVIRTFRRIRLGTDSDGEEEAAGSCMICMESVLETPEDSGEQGRACGVELPCGHRFHDTCICMWLRSRLDCPLCRSHTSACTSSSA